jgi:predicted nucleotidyltransferase
MLPVIEEKRSEIAALCREYQVVKLEVFGSAVTDEFDAERSDIDFIVHYAPDADLGPWLGRYQDLQAELASLLGRDVDLVMSEAGALRNPFFLQEATKTRTVIFDASEVASPAA